MPSLLRNLSHVAQGGLPIRRCPFWRQLPRPPLYYLTTERLSNLPWTSIRALATARTAILLAPHDQDAYGSQ